jgi:hypothetical protein
LEWETQRWVTPDPYEYMLARVAQRVQQAFHSSPGTVQVQDQFIPWVLKEKIKTNPKSREEAIANSKAMWVGALEAIGGLKVIRKTKPRPKE